MPRAVCTNALFGDEVQSDSSTEGWLTIRNPVPGTTPAHIRRHHRGGCRREPSGRHLVAVEYSGGWVLSC